MNEKYHFGFELLYRQRVYDFDIVKDKERGDFVAVRKDNILKEYDFFGERGIDDKSAGILSEIVQLYEKKKESNKKKLFERFVQNWGFWDFTSEKMSMDEFWTDISKVAVLLKRYSQVINGEFEDMKEWIEVRKLKKKVSSPKGQFTLLNDVPSIEAGYTHEISDIEKRFKLQVKIEGDELERNPIPYYQYWGFAFVTWALEGKIDWEPSLHKYSIKQKNPYLPIEELTVAPTWIPNDLLTCLYTLLFILASKKQKVCVACYCPFNPSRPDTKHCSTTCSDRLKKRRLRERMGDK